MRGQLPVRALRPRDWQERTVETPDEAAARAERAAGEDGPATEAVRSFHSAAPIRQLATERRLEAIREIMSDPPKSIRELTDRLERNHSDVELLAHHHVIHCERNGRAKRPVISYETIEFRVSVRADSEPAWDTDSKSWIGEAGKNVERLLRARAARPLSDVVL